MRHIRNPQPKLGEIRIDSIKLNPKSRDDIPALLVGLQFLYCNEDLRARLFALLEEHICPGTNRKVGRPGMDMWRILVMGVIKQGLDCDYDRLHELVNEHKTLRQFLGHSDIWDDDRYEYQTVVDNVGHLSPALLAEVSTLVVEGGHAVARKKPGDCLRERCDSFVVKTDVHFPTDVSLLWDAMRYLLRETGRAATGSGVPGWRQWKHHSCNVKHLWGRVRKTRRARPGDIEAYLACCRKLVSRVEITLPLLDRSGTPASVRAGLLEMITHAHRQIDQVDRRLLKGETVPHDEKVFSVFESHTRWISKVLVS